MTTIETIRAEIERLKDENNNIRCDSNKAYCQGYGDAFVDLLPFLSTLESEKPMNQDGLEEEIEMEWDSFSKHLAEYDDDDSDEVIWLNKFSFTDIARHFAKWGAEHLKK